MPDVLLRVSVDEGKAYKEVEEAGHDGVLADLHHVVQGLARVVTHVVVRVQDLGREQKTVIRKHWKKKGKKVYLSPEP